MTSPGASHRRHPLLQLCLALLLAAVAVGQDDAQPRPEPRIFRIGFLREGPPSRAVMEEVRSALLSNDLRLYVDPFRLEGYDSIGLYPADGPGDLLLRLNAEEFDLAFVPARVWAEQDAGYVPILQLREPEDVLDPRTGQATRRGVVFTSARFDEAAAERSENDDILSRLQQHAIAVPPSSSMAGYVMPLLKLRSQGIDRPTGGFLFFASGTDVVKAVLAGLADVGIATEGELQGTLEEAGLAQEKDRLLTVRYRTAPVPTDPVVVRRELASDLSLLGLTLRAALLPVLRDPDRPELQAGETEPRRYDELRRLVARFEDPAQ